eukprot:s70_g17.t1
MLCGILPYFYEGALPALPRRLQVAPIQLLFADFENDYWIDCPRTECYISRYQVNDRVCDCPGCEDEEMVTLWKYGGSARLKKSVEAFECDTCVPTVPFVGVSLGVAVGVGLGVGLGVSAALGGVFSAVGLVQFTVANAQEFINNPQVQQGLKKAFLRLAGLAIAESAVTLNWACAGDALAQINSKLRRLAEAVRLCFEIEIEGEQKSLDACEVLAGTSASTAGRVINEELQDVAATSGSVQVVQWTANPNPLSKNPTQNAEAPRSFEAPKAVGLDSAALPAPGPLVPNTVAQDAVPTPAIGDGFDLSRGIDFN